MPRRQRRRLVEKEQFGPAAAAHHLAPPSPEFADASKPRLARPAPRQQGPSRGVVNDAAIAGEQAAMRRRNDVAGRRDAVLQRHSKPGYSAIVVIARSVATKQSSFRTLVFHGLLRFARNDV